MSNPIKAIQSFYFDTVSELKKCTWPSRKELYESTVLVISSMIILTVLVAVADRVLELGVRFLTGGL